MGPPGTQLRPPTPPSSTPGPWPTPTPGPSYTLTPVSVLPSSTAMPSPSIDAQCAPTVPLTIWTPTPTAPLPKGTPTPIATPPPGSVWIGNTLYVPGPDGQLCPYPGCPTPPPRVRLRFDPGRVDWVGVGLDVGGIIADIVTLGTTGKLADVSEVARTAEKVLDVTSIAIDWPPFSISVVKAERPGTASADIVLDFVDLVSPVPIVVDLISLGIGLARGFYEEPLDDEP